MGYFAQPAHMAQWLIGQNSPLPLYHHNNRFGPLTNTDFHGEPPVLMIKVKLHVALAILTVGLDLVRIVADQEASRDGP